MKNKIAVLDDNRLIQMLIEEELAEEGYDVFTAGIGSQAVELIIRESPDLVVLDCTPRGSDSKALIYSIKKSFSDLPIILWTTYPFMIKSMKPIGGDHFVYKNSDFTALKREIKSTLERIEYYQKPCGLYRENRPSSAELQASDLKNI